MSKKMNNSKLIVRLLKKVLRLKKENKNLLVRQENVIKRLICLGGPLNDNRLKFSVDQLKVFQEIKNELEGLNEQ